MNTRSPWPVDEDVNYVIDNCADTRSAHSPIAFTSIFEDTDVYESRSFLPGLIRGTRAENALPSPAPVVTATPTPSTSGKKRPRDPSFPTSAMSAHSKLLSKASSHKKKLTASSSSARSRRATSIYRGVSRCSKDGRWQARIRIRKDVQYLGRFTSEVEAARRYDEAARLHHTNRAVLNFLTEKDIANGCKSVFGSEGPDDDDDEEEEEEEDDDNTEGSAE